MNSLSKIRNLKKSIFDARIKTDNDIVEISQPLPQDNQSIESEEMMARVTTGIMMDVTEPAIASSDCIYVIDGDKTTYNINMIVDRIDQKAKSIYNKSGILLGEGTITTTNAGKPAKCYTLADKYGTIHKITIAFEDCYDYHISSIILTNGSRYNNQSDIKLSDGRLVDSLDATLKEQDKIHDYFKLHFDIPPDDNYTVVEHWENGYRIKDMIDTIKSIQTKNRYADLNHIVNDTISMLSSLKQQFAEKFKVENPNDIDENPYEDHCEIFGLVKRASCTRCGRRIIVDTVRL